MIGYDSCDAGSQALQILDEHGTRALDQMDWDLVDLLWRELGL